MKSGPFFVLSTFPGCGSPCRICSAARRLDNRLAQILQRVGEKRPIGLGEIGSDVTARNVLLSRRHAIHEVRRRDVDLPQASMKTLEHLRVVGRRKHSANRCKVGPHGDCKGIMYKDAWLDSRVESSNRAVVLCEPFHNFNFRRQPRLIRLPAEPTRPGSHGCQSLWRRDPRNDIAWHQADDKPVGVAQNDRVIDGQAER